MNKRYAFYRRPDGMPDKQRNGQCPLHHILSEIGRTASLNAEGKISWPGLDVMTRFQPVLRSAVVVADSDGIELNETDAWEITWKGIYTSVKEGPGRSLDPAKLLDRIDGLCAEFCRTPLVRYVLVSSLSIADMPARKIKSGQCVVTRLKRRGKRFPPPSALTHSGHGRVFSDHIERTKYLLAKVTVAGRSVHEATDRALNSLDLLRALWSLFAAYGSWPVICSPARKPLGVIHIGPIHTLHLATGEPAVENQYWYEPGFTGDQPIFNDAGRWNQIEGNRRQAARRIASLPYRSELEALLIRYIHALDQADMDVALLHMWTILERITGTIGTNYDRTIERTIWVFPERIRGWAKDALNALRCQRNRYVHSARTSAVGEQIAYIIKSLVDPHLLLLISNPLNLNSLMEYADVLSLPTQRETLLRRKEIMSKAANFLRPASHSSRRHGAT